MLEIVVPDYRRRAALSKEHENDDLNDHQFSAELAATRTTDLGFPGSSFLVVVAAITDGYCNCCHRGRLAIIDLTLLKVAWSEQTEDAVGRYWVDPSNQLRLFRLFPDDPTVTLAVRSSSSCGGGAGGWQEETWYRPSRSSSGDLRLQPVWHGQLSYGSNGNRGGAWSQGCAEIRSLWPKRAYTYVVHELVGWVDKTAGARDPFRAIERPCEETEGDFGAVDFVSTSLLTPSQLGSWLEVDAHPKRERRELRPTVTFPFNLPVQRLLLPQDCLPAVDAPKDLTEVPSPDGALVASFQKKSKWVDRRVLEIRRLPDSTVLRQIPAPEWVDDRHRTNEYGDFQFLAVGWSRDGRRCLAVREVGLEFGPALVSLTADGKGDAWEGLLPRGKANLGDGFILDLPEPTPTPDSESTDHR